jgi:hypothetical protein
LADEPKKLSPLAAAAVALEQELVRFEQLTEQARQGQLDSQKTLEHAARATTEAAQSQERLGICMRALSDALTLARERNQAAVTALAARAQEIQARSEIIAELLRRFAAIGEAAQALTDIAASLKQRTDGGERESLLRPLQDLAAKMGVVVDEAQLLAKAATDAEVPDLAQKAAALGAQVAQAKERIAVLFGKTN